MNPIKLEDVVKSLAEQALEQENEAKRQTANQGNDGVDDDSDEHEFDPDQLDQMLKEEKTKRRATRRARAGPSTLLRTVSKRKTTADSPPLHKRTCSEGGNVDSSNAGNSPSEFSKANEAATESKSRSRGGRSARKGQKSSKNDGTYTESSSIVVKEEPATEHAQENKMNAVKSEFTDVADKENTEAAEPKTDYVHISTSIVKHKRSRHEKAHHDLVKLGCDCYLPPDDIAAGRVACCDDSCTNRVVCIECPPKCRLGRACCNQRMQRKQYLPIEVRYAGKKGYGLYALQPGTVGDLVIEYVGEIVTQRQFNKRAKQYEKSGIRHHYFMTLSNDELIDATRKGNEGRFINHSCDPNCETQKWIVNGETRIGFFARRDVAVGEELTIDYQFVRFGSQRAVRCLCGARNCRGIIGVESSAAASAGRSGAKTQFEIDLNKLVEAGALKTSANALRFAHVFIHATKDDDILTLVRVLQNSEPHIEGLKAFLRLHGLNILHCYMTQLKFSKKPLPLMNEVMAVLQVLVDSNAITSRNGLEDSGIMRELDEWAGLKSPQMPVTATATTAALTPAADATAASSVVSSTKASPVKSLHATTAGSDSLSQKSSTVSGGVPSPEKSLQIQDNSTTTLLESTLEQLKRDEAQAEQTRFEKVYTSICEQVNSLDLLTTIDTFETGLIDCCKAPTAEERRQHAQQIRLVCPKLASESHNRMLTDAADGELDITAEVTALKKKSAVLANVKKEEGSDIKPAAASTAAAAAQPFVVLDQINYSSSSDDDDDDEEDEEEDMDEDMEREKKVDSLLFSDAAAGAPTSESPGPSSSSLSKSPSKFRTANSTTPSQVRVKQTPYMRLLTFLNELERQMRIDAEAETRKQQRAERKERRAVALAEAAAVAASAGEDLAADKKVVAVDEEDAMDIVGSDDEDASLAGTRNRSASPQKQMSAVTLLEHADEQFRHDINETKRLRQYTLEFIDYCKQNLHMVFKIQKRSAAAVSAAAAAAALASKQSTASSSSSPTAVKQETTSSSSKAAEHRNNMPEKYAAEKSSSILSPPPSQHQPQHIPAPYIAAPPTPHQLYEQHKKLMSEFVPVMYADEEKRRNEREKLVNERNSGQRGGADSLNQTPSGGDLSVAAERTAQLFEKQVEKQDMYDAWMLAVKASAQYGATRAAAVMQQQAAAANTGSITSTSNNKEAQYYAQHRNQVLQTVMHYMNGTRKPPDKQRVKQEVRQQRQRIIAQPNYFMVVPPPHQQAPGGGPPAPRPNQELKASIYSRIQSDICACVAEKVSKQFGQLLQDAKGDELQKRLHVLLPTGERILLSDNKYTFENQRKYRSLMPLKVGSNEWNFRLLQLKRFSLVKDFFARAASKNGSSNSQQAGKNNISKTAGDEANIPALCNPATAGYTSNFDHVFYHNKKYDLPKTDQQQPNSSDTPSNDADDADSDENVDLKLPLPRGINIAFNQQGPKGLLYCWDEETLQSSWLMPKADLDETMDDFVRGAVPMANAPPPPSAIKNEQQSRMLSRSTSASGMASSSASGSTVRLPHDATFTRFVWKDSFHAALPQTYENEWLELINEDVSMSDLDTADNAATTINVAANLPVEKQHANRGSVNGSSSKVSSSLAEWQAAAASTLLRRNRHGGSSAIAAAEQQSPLIVPTATTGGPGRTSDSSSEGNRSRRASGTISGGAADADNSGVMLTKSEFRDRISRHIVNALNPFRKPSCQKGRIQSKEHFKLLARELTHKIVDAELQRHHREKQNDLRCFLYSGKLETKIEQYVTKYMSRFGKIYDPSAAPSRRLSSSKGIRSKPRRPALMSSRQHQRQQQHDEQQHNVQINEEEEEEADVGARSPDDADEEDVVARAPSEHEDDDVSIKQRLSPAVAEEESAQLADDEDEVMTESTSHDRYQNDTPNAAAGSVFHSDDAGADSEDVVASSRQEIYGSGYSPAAVTGDTAAVAGDNVVDDGDYD